jgi:Fe-S oxidoreductase
VDKTEPVVNTYIKFDKEGGILRAAEKCNGSGDCRRLSFTGAMMCPSYMASRNEWDSTRGRANVLRTLLTNEGSNGFASSELLVAMKNCVGCKGCSKECPSSIDMALMRLEVLYQNRGNRTFSDLIFARIHYLVYFQKFSSLINYLLKLSIVKKVLGIDESRSIPAIGRGELLSEVLKKNSINGVLGKENVVILWVDEFTALYNPDLVQKSIVVLEALDFNVILIYLPSSRALLSGGFLPQAKSMIMETVKSLFTYSTLLGYPPILGLEPSATLSFNDEYLKLLSVDEINKYHSLIGKTWTIDSFLSHHLRKSIIKRHRFKAIKGEVLIHVHCHQKSLESPGDTAFVLKTLLGAKVTSLRSSCCGMAGSFGLKKENDQMSKNMFDLVIGPAIRDSHWDWIVATGVSCRQQVSDLTGRDAVHMVDLLWYGINYPEE